jgi:hypothetical protein
VSEAGATSRSGGLPRTAREAAAGVKSPRARVSVPDAWRGWPLRHLGDDAVLVSTGLVSDALTHAVPSAAAGAPEAGLGLVPGSGHPTPIDCDPDGNAPVFNPSDGSALREHGRGPCIVDALAQEWGRTPRPPAGKTVRATLPTRPLT